MELVSLWVGWFICKVESNLCKVSHKFSGSTKMSVCMLVQMEIISRPGRLLVSKGERQIQLVAAGVQRADRKL